MNAELTTIAKNANLRIITTDGAINPESELTFEAITGFSTFEEADELAEKNGMNVGLFSRKDGEDVWKFGTLLTEPVALSPEYVGYEYETNDVDDLLDDFNGFVDGLESFDDVEYFLSCYRAVERGVENLKEDEVVFYKLSASSGMSYDIYCKHPTEWSYDCKNYCIAVY